MPIKPNDLRKSVLRMVYEKQSGHIGGCFSIAEIVAFLFNEFNPLEEDKIIMSKGHAVPILYAALFEKGILTSEDLSTFREVDSKLQGHPVHWLIPELVATTGSLGQGLSIAAGHALAKKIKQEDGRIFCILGDGEMQEGQIYECLMFLNKYKLNNLVVILDANGAQNDGLVSEIMPLSYKNVVTAFGLDYIEIENGNEYQSLSIIKNKLEIANKTLFVDLKTVKGFGVDFMQTPTWHSKSPNEAEYIKAMEKLNENSN
jgi:transketolase